MAIDYKSAGVDVEAGYEAVKLGRNFVGKYYLSFVSAEFQLKVDKFYAYLHKIFLHKIVDTSRRRTTTTSLAIWEALAVFTHWATRKTATAWLQAPTE